jgi:hypothetical protein
MAQHSDDTRKTISGIPLKPVYGADDLPEGQIEAVVAGPDVRSRPS